MSSPPGRPQPPVARPPLPQDGITKSYTNTLKIITLSLQDLYFPDDLLLQDLPE